MMEEMLSHRSGREGIIVGDSIDDEAEMGEHLSILSQDREKIKRYLSEEDREWQVWSTDSHEYGEIVIKSTQYEDDEGSEVWKIKNESSDKSTILFSYFCLIYVGPDL